jgi:excisionase family DNA binding protein
MARYRRMHPVELRHCSECPAQLEGRQRAVCSSTCRERRWRRLHPEAAAEKQRRKRARRRERRARGESFLSALSAELVTALEELVDERVNDRFEGVAAASDSVSPWLSVVEAAELLRCKRQRVDDLLSQGRLARYKDGSRTLVAEVSSTSTSGSSADEECCPTVAPCRAIPHGCKGSESARRVGIGW